MSEAPPDRSAWVQRRQALGAAQATYLWVLFVSCLFFAAVRAVPGANPPLIKAPILDLEVGANVVALFGPGVIAFLVLIFMGALRASATAVSEGGIVDFKGEVFDLHPNALDLAFYTSPASPRVLRVLTYFKYPAFLTLALLEAFWLWRVLPQRWTHPALLVATILWLAAGLQVGWMWARRFKKVPELLKSDRISREREPSNNELQRTRPAQAMEPRR